MFKFLMNFMKAKKLLPKISKTEREALEAGTVWIDGQFFAGKPNFKKILEEPYHKISEEEQAFLDGPAEQLCQMIDRYEISQTRIIPDEVMKFLKEQGFMSMLIPKKYGGLEFSSLGISTVLQKITPYSNVVGTFVIIASSLGAAELLKHYGTEEQKKKYLPGLASGELIPCFGLTEPNAGSDAASMTSSAEVFKDSDGSVKIKVNFEKRYITLAPVANLISIACKLEDPENLLEKGENPGITVVLINKDLPGVEIGNHHIPIGDPFYNGPIRGHDVIITPDEIIGGSDYAGKGWRMLMEQLAGGRAITLPGGAVGAMKATSAVAGAYSMIRHQFGIPIGKMEGIVDKLAKIASLTYAFDAMRTFTCNAVDNGQQPPVVSAILKAYGTELAQELVTDGMDIMAGSGVMLGPNNILGAGYAGAPVGITVEGANIMTRTLIIFGQGATRCHPYAYKVISAVDSNDAKGFRNNLLSWIGHFFVTTLRKTLRTITRGFTVSAPGGRETKSYYRRLGWASTRFAFLTNLAVFFVGGRLKAKGMLTGRYADAIAWQLFATSTLRRYEAEGRKREDLPLVQYACEHSLYEVQQAFEGIYKNIDAPIIGLWMKTIGHFLLRFNPVGTKPSDSLALKAAKTVQNLDNQFERLTEGVFIPADDQPGIGTLMKAFKALHAAEDPAKKIYQAQKARKLPRGIPMELADEAEKAGIIDLREATLLRVAYASCQEAIQVDEFTPAEFFKKQKAGFLK